MPFPSPLRNVPRDQVGSVVHIMLMNADVKAIEAHEQESGKFTVIPHHSSASASSAAAIAPFRKGDLQG